MENDLIKDRISKNSMNWRWAKNSIFNENIGLSIIANCAVSQIKKLNGWLIMQLFAFF